MSSEPRSASVVLLVDSKTRDLPVATLIAHHLRMQGITAWLEPLEAYQGVLAAHRPELILFNHLTANHLARYSQRLAELGVLTAVLPNEGIMYDPDDLRFNAGKFHPSAHIDCFFCWNTPHADALREAGFDRRTRIEVVGVPRFDFYFEPWSRLFRRPAARARSRPQILFCTNFVTAKFWEPPREQGDKFFAAWQDRIPLYRNYWAAIEAHFKGRARSLDFLRAILADGRYDVVLRPHPREEIGFYEEFLARLPAPQRERVTLQAASSITELILDCDLELSIETCTTAMESWIAGKPTLEIVLERHPLWHIRDQAVCGLACDRPEKLVPLIEQSLAAPPQPELAARRRGHLAKWCAAPDGTSSERLARVIAEAVRQKRPTDWSRLTATDHRRATKLRALRRLGHAYHYDPFMPLKRALFASRYAIKDHAYRKSIKPGDVTAAQAELNACLNRNN